MLMRTDPFRDLDRLTQQVFGTTSRPAAMPMDACRNGDSFVVRVRPARHRPGLDRPRRRTQRAHRQGRAARPARTPSWSPRNAAAACSAAS